MNPEKKDIKKWVKALRSGKYKQGYGLLETDAGHCCLGVACRIFIPPKNLNMKCSNLLSGGDPHGQLNSPKWLQEINGNFCGKTEKTLITLNDNIDFRLSFDEIADCLEAVYIHEVLG